jgi:hypothetical protein
MLARSRGFGFWLLLLLVGCSSAEQKLHVRDDAAGQAGVAAGGAPEPGGPQGGREGAGESGGGADTGTVAAAGASEAGQAGSAGSSGCSEVTLGPDGGQALGPDGTSLSVPARAIDEETAFCIYDDTADAPARDEFAIGSAYAIVPHATPFDTPATVRLPVTRGSSNEVSSHDSEIAGSPIRVISAEADGAWHDVADARLLHDAGHDFVEAPAVRLSHWSVTCAWRTTYTPVLRVFTSATPELISEVQPVNGEFPVAIDDDVHVVLDASYRTQFNPAYFPEHPTLEGPSTSINGWSLLQDWGQEAENAAVSSIAGAASSAQRVIVSASAGFDGGSVQTKLDWDNDGAPERACFAYAGLGEALSVKLRLVGSKRMSIAAGGSVSFAIATNGKVYGWGSNTSGSLGNGSTSPVDTPAEIAALTGAKQISTRGDHGLALMADGSVLAWGSNNYHQVANGSTAQQLTPVVVPGLARVRSVSAGYNNSFALLEDGTVAMWGLPLGGPDSQFSFDSLPTIDTPTPVAGLKQCVSIQGSGLNFATALTADGSVWTWGSNLAGELGDGNKSEGTGDFQRYDRAAPGLVSLPIRGRSIASGALGSVVVGWDGSLWTWGGGFTDQDDGILPFQVLGLTSAIAAVSAGTRQTFLASDGQLWQWTKATSDAATPLSVGGAVQIAVSPDHSLALDEEGKVWTWGADDMGQLGDGPDVRPDAETPAELTNFDLDGP